MKLKRALLCLLLAACGPQLYEPSLPLDLVLSRAISDSVESLQVTFLSNGSALDCSFAPKSCVVNQVDRSRFLKVQDSSGKETQAVLFPLLVANGTQELSVSGIPTGKDYALVVEAISKGSNKQLVGSSCNYLKEITAGNNPRVTTAPIQPFDGGFRPDGGFIVGAVNCDPRLER